MLPTLGTRCVDELAAVDVAELVGTLAASGYKRETIAKSVTALAQVLDFVGVSPNPARDKLHVRLPREERDEPSPPTAAHVEAVLRLLPSKHRLAFLFLDWSGARVAAVDSTLVSDYDEPRRRVRLRAATQPRRRVLACLRCHWQGAIWSPAGFHTHGRTVVALVPRVVRVVPREVRRELVAEAVGWLDGHWSGEPFVPDELLPLVTVA